MRTLLGSTDTPPRPPATFALHRLTVAEYHRMIDEGILTERRVELLEGWLVDKMANNPEHSYPVQNLTLILAKILPAEWIVRVQLPITLSDSEPEPDIAIVRGPKNRYARRHPSADDVGVVIEVSNESLARDRKDKLRIYAAAQIPQYWIVNVRAGVVEFFQRPKNGSQNVYRLTRTYKKSESVPLVLDGKKAAEIAVRDILK
jgi:Uma2 family endonuclease